MMQVHQLFVSPKSHFIAVRMTIYIYISWKKETILVPLSVALPISLLFMKEPHGQGQPLNGSFKLTLSWK